MILPAYNAEKTIEKAINSIINGLYKNLEVVVVNDGSTDSTKEVVEKLTKQDSRIKLFNQVNQGVGKARATGIDNATGEYIAWCDADVTVSRSWIPGTPDEYNPNEVNIWENEEILEAFLMYKGVTVFLWDKLIKRSLFKDGEYDNSYYCSEDVFLLWSMLKNATKVVRFNTTKYNWYRNPESLCSGKNGAKKVDADVEIWQKIVNDCCGKKLHMHLQSARVSRSLWLFGTFRIMVKDGYHDADFERMVQRYLKEEGLHMRNYMYRMWAFITIISPKFSRLIFSTLFKLNYFRKRIHT